MRLVVVSHKECYASADSPSGYATIGGFPFQMHALSGLFDGIALVLPMYGGEAPSGAQPLVGHNLSLRPLDAPRGTDLLRKLDLLFWLPRNLPRICREISQADAVHAPVPGDIGTIGILVALAQRKPLFVRHCGTWGYRGTLAGHILMWLLERIAGGRNVVMATGGSDSPPCQKNPAIAWVFSTTLSEQDLASIRRCDLWQVGKPLKLITVARLDPGKNVESVVRALPLIRTRYSQVTLDVIGDGPCLEALKVLARDLGVTDAVTYHGRLAHREVLDHLSQSHLFVFPTRVPEGFPKAVLEALACGLPVLAPPVSVLSHLIGTRNGLLLGRTDADSVAAAVLQIISDGTRYGEMSASAWKTARNHSLERWEEVIRMKLTSCWGPLRRDDGHVTHASRIVVAAHSD